MYLMGKAWISLESVLALFEIEHAATFYNQGYKEMLKDTEKLTLGINIYYERDGVYKALDELSTKEVFLIEVQKCLMLILDESGHTKRRIAKNLGMSNIGVLDSFLSNSKYTKRVATILVKMWRYYKHIVIKYDKEF